MTGNAEHHFIWIVPLCTLSFVIFYLGFVSLLSCNSFFEQLWIQKLRQIYMELFYFLYGIFLKNKRFQIWQSPVYHLGFSGGSAGKEYTSNAGDLGLIPGLRRFPGEGKGYPLQYSGLEKSTDCTVHRVAKSRTPLSDLHFHCYQLFFFYSLCFSCPGKPGYISQPKRQKDFLLFSSRGFRILTFLFRFLLHFLVIFVNVKGQVSLFPI